MRKLPIVGQEKSEPKTLMPEVLPEPPAPHGEPSSPRQRTVKHMRKLLAAAAVAGIAATTTRSQATDAGTDASIDDGGADAIAEDATDAAPDADAAEDTGFSYYDGPVGHDPAPPPPDGSMNIGHDPAGPSPGASTGNSSGCGCSVVGKKTP